MQVLAAAQSLMILLAKKVPRVPGVVVAEVVVAEGWMDALFWWVCRTL